MADINEYYIRTAYELNEIALKNGTNELVFYDDNGASKRFVHIERGEWAEKEVFDSSGHVDMLQSARCTKCNKYHTTPYSYYFTDYSFCPNCGADMRKGEEE